MAPHSPVSHNDLPRHITRIPQQPAYRRHIFHELLFHFDCLLRKNEKRYENKIINYPDSSSPAVSVNAGRRLYRHYVEK